jgi:adenosine deaminase
MTAEDWRARLRRAVESNDRAALASVPKTDLHCHALLSAPWATYEALSGQPLPPPPKVFGDFRSFIAYIATNCSPVLSGAGAVRTLIAAALQRMVADGVVYAEMSFDLLVPELIGLSERAFAELIAEECARVATGLIVAPEIGIARGLPADEVAPRLKRWLATATFKGIDLYDDETLGSLGDFAPLYRMAADHGLKLKAHAGELRGPDHVRDSVALLNLHAVQHGVRAAEDPAVGEFLAARGTLLHICPTSNYSLGICDALENHPARRLFDQGVKITVNSDDFSLFGMDVTDEILNLKQMGFDANEIEQIVENGLAEIPAEQGNRL